MNGAPITESDSVAPMAVRTRIPLLALLCAVCAIGLAACGDDDGSVASTRSDTGSDAFPALELAQVGAFDMPVAAVPVPGTDQVAVVEQGGRVLVVSGMSCVDSDRCPDEPVDDGDVILDLGDRVSAGGERGLLGLAFHPDWPDDPRIFIDYTDSRGATRVEAWTLAAPTASAERATELLRIPQPYANHNGGHLAFGPDGLLYVGTGDGGSGGDPGDRAQEGDELLGKLLRLDVDAGGERGYGIPEGNLAAGDGAEQVWAVGLRNPWRFSFDPKTGDLWIGDVGQASWEEIDALAADELDGPTPNFGWRRFEGYESFDDSGQVGPGELVEPVLAYGRDAGCSITGGVVYRGEQVPALDGWYLFGDFCADDVRALRSDDVPGGSFESGELDWQSFDGVGSIVSFATVQGGEVLALSLRGGVYQVVEAG